MDRPFYDLLCPPAACKVIAAGTSVEMEAKVEKDCDSDAVEVETIGKLCFRIKA